MKKCIAKHRFDNLAQLRETVNKVADKYARHGADTILSCNGPMTLNVIEERLTDGSIVYDFGLAVMTAEQVRREAE